MKADTTWEVRALLGAVGFCVFFGLWQIIGYYELAGLSWPSLSSVIDMLIDPNRRPLFVRAISATLRSTGAGYLLGASLGLFLACVTHLQPLLRRGGDRLAAVLNSVPSIALAPIFLLLLNRDATPAAVASIHVFFIVYVSVTSGLASASAAHQDLFTVLGASRVARFWRLEMLAALPALVSGLRLSWPAALIGAIIGEWFGAPRGLGILIINAMQNFQIVLLWCAVFLAVITSLTFYSLITVLERTIYRRFR